MNVSTRWFAACAMTSGVLFVSTSILAAPDEASVLYKKGVAAMNAGNLDQACPMLSQSYDKTPALPTLFALAECERKQERTSAALEHYRAYLERYRAAGKGEQTKEAAHKDAAEKQVASIEKSMADLTFVLPEGAEGAIVRLDGRVIPFLTNVKVEPGEHMAVLELPDGKKVGTKVVAAAGEQKTIKLEGGEKPPPAEASPAPEPAPEKAKPEETKAPPPIKKSSPITAGVVVSGVIGVAGIAVGSVYGVMAMNKAQIVDAHCIDVLCDAQGKQAGKDGKTLGWISTGAFAVGVIGLGAAVIMIATHDASPASSAASAASATTWRPIVGGVERGGFIGAGRAW